MPCDSRCHGYAALSLSRLADPCVLEPLLKRFALYYPGSNRAAVVSQWSMNYLSVVLPSALVPALALDMAIDICGDGATLLHDDARPMAVKPGSEPRPQSLDQWPQFCQRLLSGHLEPVFSGLATAGGVAPKVLWNNLVVVWDELFRRLGLHLPDRRDLRNAHRWLDQATVGGGRLDLRKLQRLVDSPAPELSPQIALRRHCCLHYQLHAPVEGQFPVWCESCPKLHRRPPEDQVRYLYQLQLENDQD